MLLINLLGISPAHAVTFNCGTSGTYTVVAGHVTGNSSCKGRLELDPSVTHVNNMAFFLMFGLGITELIIPPSVVAIGDYAFFLQSISTLVIPSSVISIGESAFEYINSLTSITIANSVTTIGRNAFRSSNVTELIIGSGASLIESDTYQEYRNISKVVIPEGVTRIDPGAFSEWYSVTTFTLPSTLTDLRSSSLRGMRSLRTINIPTGLSTVNDYFGYLGTANTSVPYLCSTTGASSTSGVNDYFSTLIAFNTTAGRCSNSFDAPIITSVTISDSTSATVNFTPPTNFGAGTEIASYAVVAFPGGRRATVSGAAARSVTLNLLTPGTTYTFEVNAINNEGSAVTSPPSTRSASITCCTAAATEQERTAQATAAALAAQKAAEAKREAEKQAARTEIWDCLSDSRIITFNNFTNAEIYGVTKKNYDHVIQDINYKLFDESSTALIESKELTIFVVEQVVKKYVILDLMCYPGTFSQYSAKDLASVGLIPYEYQNTITYKLRKLPVSQRDDYDEVENAIANEILVLETRKYRLDELLSWNLPKDDILPEPAKNGTFPCGSGGTYTVVSGHVTGSKKCAGKLTIVSSVIAIDDYAFSKNRFLGPPSFKLIMQEPEITELVIPRTVLSIGQSAFSDNQSLISISISNSVKTIGRDAFRQSNNVTSLSIGTGATIIESDTYQEFRYLTKLVVPEGVTRIDGGAFSEYYSLTSLTLPSTLTNLGWSSLRGMHSLRTVNIPTTLSKIDDPFGYIWYAPLSVPYLCSTTGASNTASVNAYFATLIAYNTAAGRCTNSFDAPIITSVTYPSSTSATINFTPPSNFGAGTAISSYSLIALPGGKRVSVSGDSARSITIDSLIPGQIYAFEVTAINNENPIISSSPSVRRFAMTK